MKKHGNLRVVQFIIVRAHVKKFVNKPFDFITLGQWSSLKKKYGYDQFFHLSCVVGLANNQKVTVEKLQRVNIEPGPGDAPRSDAQQMPIQNMNDGGSPRTLNEMIEKTRQRMGKSFFEYNAFSWNCQHFLMNFLQANNINYPQAEDFIMQPVDQFAKELPGYARSIANLGTDVATKWDTLTGKGD